MLLTKPRQPFRKLRRIKYDLINVIGITNTSFAKLGDLPFGIFRRLLSWSIDYFLYFDENTRLTKMINIMYGTARFTLYHHIFMDFIGQIIMPFGLAERNAPWHVSWYAYYSVHPKTHR